MEFICTHSQALTHACVLWAIEMNIHGFVPSIIIKTVAANKIKKIDWKKETATGNSGNRKTFQAHFTTHNFLFKWVSFDRWNEKCCFPFPSLRRKHVCSCQKCRWKLWKLWNHYDIVRFIFVTSGMHWLCALKSLFCIEGTRKEEGDEEAEEESVQHI